MIFINTLKSTIRYLLRDKSYVMVNVLSLAVGLICCLFVFKYVQDELSYDRFHENADRIFRIEYETVMEDGAVSRFANLHGSVLPEWLPSVSEIELKTRFAQHADLVFELEGELFEERNVLAADSTFFRLFTFNLIEGTPELVLAAPNSIVISRSTAQKYFNTTDATGKVLTVRFRDREVLLTVTGVMEDVPSNSHFSFDMVTQSRTYEELYGHSLDDIQQAYSYIRVGDGVSVAQLEPTLNEINIQHDPDTRISYYLQAITDIHLHSEARGELAPNGSSSTIYVLIFIALVILTIACVNFTTLAAARSVKRTSEISIRKVYGAGKGSLIFTFLFEGILLAIFALALALAAGWELLPRFNQLAGKTITASQLVEPSFLLAMIVTAIVAGCIAGFYPLLLFINNKPGFLLPHRSFTGLKRGAFWKGVIISQIATTIALIFASYIVHQQVNFIQNKELGFDREQIVTFPNYFEGNPEPFMNRLDHVTGVEHVTISSYVPGVNRTSGTAEIKAEGRTDAVTYDWISVDHNYLDTYGINLVEGRNFSQDRPADATQAFIINETAATRLGWEEPLGRRMEGFEREGEVIGVVEDFNFLSLHNEVSPLVIVIYKPFYWTISAKIHSGRQLSETLSNIEMIWQEMVPGTPFTFEFVDDQFAAVYENEQKTRSLFLVFSVLAIAIAVLGLLSFASFTVQQKTREIGIRKVLGASVFDILQQIYADYTRLLIIAAFIALPVAFMWMNSWLQNFSYKTEIGVDAFAVPLVLALIVLIVSVSYQAVKGAGRNPVDSIRVE